MTCDTDQVTAAQTNQRDRQLALPPGVPPLSSHYVYLTGGCNLACRHCWLSPTFQPDGGTGGHLDYDLFALAIEEGLPLGLSHVKLTGGEPLLHPDFVKMVDRLREKELGLTIETNGTLITDTLARYLKEKSTLGHIAVSLDGATPETHDAFRGVKGSFERACQGVRHLVEAGFRPQVIMSVHPGNVDEIEPLVRLAEGMGAGSVKFNLIQPTGRGQLMTQRGQALDIRRLIELGRWVEGELQGRTGISLHYSWPMAFHSMKHLLTGGGGVCNIFGILGILPAGQLAMCGMGVETRDLCYGQLGTDRLPDVWRDHPTLGVLRGSLPGSLEGVCGRCLLRNRCLGSCVAENYNQAGRMTAANWFCEQAEQVGLFPTSRLENGSGPSLDGDRGH